MFNTILYNNLEHNYHSHIYERNQLELYNKKENHLLLKNGIWVYYFLLIFEGALRKWILPELSTPLLIVRDPVALWLILTAVRYKLLPLSIYLISVTIIGLIGIFTAVLFGHGSLAVAIFGARILILHFPLVFVIGRIFYRSDVVKMGIVTLWITIPMTILIAFQFYSPQSSWVNRGVGGDLAGAGFSGALGYLRPPGTFSFTNGNSLFFGFSSCYALFFLLHFKLINRFLTISSCVCILIAIPFSISRSLLFQIALSVLFTILAVIQKPKYLGKIIITSLFLFLALSLLSQIDIFQIPIEAFTTRFDTANKQEGGIDGVFIDRFMGGLIGALSSSSKLPFFGFGLGIGTNVGSQLVEGKRGFIVSEGEWGRLIGELGPLLGLIIVFIRVSLTAKIAFFSYKKLQVGDFLPWILLSYGLIAISQGNWSQSTSLGFCTLITGLILASLREQAPYN